MECHREDVLHSFRGQEIVTITVNITPQNKSSQSFRPIRRVAASASSSLASTRDICSLESEYVFFRYP